PATTASASASTGRAKKANAKRLQQRARNAADLKSAYASLRSTCLHPRNARAARAFADAQVRQAQEIVNTPEEEPVMPEVVESLMTDAIDSIAGIREELQRRLETLDSAIQTIGRLEKDESRKTRATSQSDQLIPAWRTEIASLSQQDNALKAKSKELVLEQKANVFLVHPEPALFREFDKDGGVAVRLS